MKKFIRILFLSFFLFTGVQAIYAQTATMPAGSGTQSDPYQIATLSNLYWVSQNSSSWRSYFVQTADINAADTKNWNSGIGFYVIGNYSTHFNGTYDGQGHIVDSLYISRNNYLGLFGYAGSSATIKNVGVTHVDMVFGHNNVGGLVGYNDGRVQNCYATGIISGQGVTGGLVGNNLGTVYNCYASGSVSGSSSIGGLVGDNAGIVQSSYATSSISGSVGSSYVGGLVGTNFGTVKNSYATGSVLGNSGSYYVGGLVGNNYASYLSTSIINCYATGSVSGDNYVGGLVGWNVDNGGYAVITDSFWNTETTGQIAGWDSSSDVDHVTGSHGLTIKQMQTESNFTDAGWDFQGETNNGTADIWGVNESNNGGYPFLSWQGYVAVVRPSGSGTSSDPYKIATLYDLCWLSQNPSSWGSHFVQTANIDAADTKSWNSGAGFSPIGIGGNNFTGTYDGQGHTIDSLYIFQNSTISVGLFGYTAKNSIIKNLGVTHVNIIGYEYVGGLVGYNYSGTVLDCYVTGSISGTSCVGGLVGGNQGAIQGCYASSAVSGTSDVGGLIGENQATVENCYSTSSVSGTLDVGGLVGWNKGTLGIASISYSYASGSIKGSTSLGGLVGWNYDDGGQAIIKNSYWNTSTTGQTAGWGSSSSTNYITNSNGLLVAQMQNQIIFTEYGWDFQGETANGTADIWGMNRFDNGGYPFLSWQGYVAVIAPSGSGTSSDPYHIATLNNLCWVSQNMSSWGSYFVQTADVNAADTKKEGSGYGFYPIGNTTTNFTGTYDGQGHTIDSLYISRGSTEYMGLFGYTGTGSIIENVGLTHGNIKGFDYTGGLVGENYGTVKNCYTKGNVSGFYCVGGLAGTNNGAVQYCFAVCSVSGGGEIGGLVGNNSSGMVQNCYAMGSVSAVSIDAGGLVGINNGSNGTASIYNSYATGKVNGTGGGLVGMNWSSPAIISNSFWNTTTTGKTVGWGNNSSTNYITGSRGLTTAQMQTEPTFTDVGWDFQGETANGTADIWGINKSDNGGYPFLSLQGYPITSAPSGSGTSSDPYQIATLNNLYWVSQNSFSWGSYFVQKANINAADTKTWSSEGGFSPIGNGTIHFTGTYNGQGYTIDSLYISRDSTDYVGLFGYTSSSSMIKNIGVTHANIVAGHYWVGGLVGNNYGTVQSSYTTGSVSGSSVVGGLVGNNYGTVQNSYAIGIIKGGSVVGGLVGKSYDTEQNCYASGSVSGTSGVGGLVGDNYSGMVQNCYATGLVSGTSYFGGLVGRNYDNGGQAVLTNSFWNTETTGQKAGWGSGSDADYITGSQGLTTAHMRTLSTFTAVSWDFTAVWGMNNAVNDGYPFLLWQEPYSWVGSTSSDWQTTSNWYNDALPDLTKDIYINRSATNFPVIDSGTFAKSHKIVVDKNAAFTVSAGGSFTISDSLINNGTFTIASSASGDGSLIVDTAVSGDGTFIRQQNMDNDDGWHMISSASCCDTIVGSDFVPDGMGSPSTLSTDFDFYFFDQSQTSCWVNVRASDNTVNNSFEKEFIPGKGYLVAYAPGYGKNTMEFHGPFNVGDVTVPLEYTSGVRWEGWNLIGNPYTSAIDWNKADLSVFADNFAYVYDPDKAGGAGYEVVDGSTSGAYLAPGQAFFVDALAAGSFNFTHSMQVHQNNSILKQTEAFDNDIILQLSSDSNYDQTTIRVIAGSKDARDRYDALKLFSLDTSIPQLCSYTSDSVKVDVNSYPEEDSINTVKLGMYIPFEGTYSISLQQQAGVFENKHLVLKDLSVGTKVDLSEKGNYTFEANQGYSARFVLIIDGTADIPKKTLEKETMVYAYRNNIYIQSRTNNPLNGTVVINNLMGEKIYQSQLDGTSKQVLRLNLNSGVYIVRLQTKAGGCIAKKVVIER
ncbi:MAG: T9SS type A sorting domain-containing protein [Bacteroidales bacterium]|nr:T9SS type A sorting domain-containing protein [Bacteroidales bacterium]